MFKKLLVLLTISLLVTAPSLAYESGEKNDGKLCKEIAELGKKYEAEKKLPDSVVVEGKPCSKDELTQCLLSLLDKVLQKCGKEGAESIPREDLDRIAALHEALKAELTHYEGYVSRRDTIEKILAGPEALTLEYRLGINGFLRGEGLNNFKPGNLSYAPNHSEGRFLYRVKPYAYWHPTDYLEIHLEGQGYGFTGGNEGGSLSSGTYSLYQGFVEAKIPEKDWLALKGGRQEFLYGSTFILGTNSFFSGLAFDAARLRLKPLAPLTIDLLGGRYATAFSNGLKGNLEGVYAIYAFSEGNTAEAYAFRDTGSVNHHMGESLDIFGLRGTAKLDTVLLELEPVCESGRILDPATGVNDSISAYGGHADAAVDATLWSYHNKFFVSYAIGSGNKDAANRVKFSREFRDPDNDTSLVGDMHVIGDLSGVNVSGHHASGLQIHTLGWGIDLTNKINFTATGHYFLANAVEDGFSRRIGLETDFNLTWTIDKDFSLIFAYDRFLAGDFFRDASGRGDDIQYGYIMLQFDFSKTKLKAPKT